MGTKEKLKIALDAMLREIQGLETLIEDSKRKGSQDYEHWGPKDLLAHAAEWTGRRVELLRAGDAAEPRQEADPLTDINRILFERHRDTPWDEVIGLLIAGLNALIGEVERREEAELLVEDSHARGNTVWRGIAFYGIVHSLTHIAEALVRAGESDAAVRLQRAMTPPLLAINEARPWRGLVEHGLGRVLALAGDLGEAVIHTRKAISDNPDVVKWVGNDQVFDSIRGDLEPKST